MRGGDAAAFSKLWSRQSNGRGCLTVSVKSDPAPTVRSLARELGVSHTTVSDALRGKGRVDPATVARVQQAARAAGYRRNPLAAAVRSEPQRSRGATFHGVLAAVDLIEPPRRDPHGAFHTQLVAGGRAVELLIAPLQRNEVGVPEWPTTTTIAARWVEGPTLRGLDARSPPVAPG